MKYFPLGVLFAGVSLFVEAKTEFDCMIEPFYTVELRSPVVGLIQQLHVVRGTVVKKNAPLVTIDSGVERSAVNVAKFKSEAQGALQVAESKLISAQEKAKRNRQLYEEKFVSAQALEEADAEYKLAEAEVKSATENLQLAKLEHRQTQEMLERRVLRSPFPGVVVNVYLSPGALVDTSESKKPILKLVETDKLRVEAFIPMKYFTNIKKGANVTIKPEAPLIITTVDGVIDSASGTFGILVELDNPSGTIPAGSRCKIGIDGVQ
jgi:RND family efflux transporter MFP subunit